jgi:thiamine biosynthesis protein ThiC
LNHHDVNFNIGDDLRPGLIADANQLTRLENLRRRWSRALCSNSMARFGMQRSRQNHFRRAT